MKIESTTEIERWEQFRNLTVKVVSVVASEFPHPVELDPAELIERQPISEEERFVCTETVKRRRELRAKLVSKVVAEVGNAALLRLRQDAQAASDAPTNWKEDFRRAVDLVASQIASSPGFHAQRAVDRILLERADAAAKVDDADPGPQTYVKLRHLAGATEALDRRLQDVVIDVIRPRLVEAQEPVDPAALDVLAKYLLTKKLDEDLRRSAEEAPDWLTSPDGLLTTSHTAMDMLLALTKRSFDEACRDVPLHDWARVDALRKSHVERQHLGETLAGTISYLVDAGILLKKPDNDVVRYTLSPAMVAPLMASTASGSGDSGFKLLSKLRTATTPAFKELAKEAAQIVFTSATIGLGKLALGS